MRMRFLRGLLPALALAALPAVSSAALFVGVSVNFAPPALPVYVQPPCPEQGYLWSPGYWSWDTDAGAYYWVPGTWVEPPEVGFLWTPGYWGWADGAYLWHGGYWGRHVGFYGGVNYGYGYDGAGFEGGYWRGNRFMYNRAVVHVGPRFATNVYSRPDSYRGGYAHVSFNGGPGGVVAHPSRAQLAAAHDHHVGFTSVQQHQQRLASTDRSARADYNHGRPSIAATARAGEFRGSGVSAARAAGGHYTPHAASPHAASMRSDRPPGATGQPRGGRTVGHAAPMHEQSRMQRASQERQSFRPQARPQEHQTFRPQERQTFRPQERPQERQTFRPQERPQEHQSPRPQERPQEHQSPRPQARPQPQRQAPHAQPPRGGAGGEHRPDNHGGGQKR